MPDSPYSPQERKRAGVTNDMAAAWRRDPRIFARQICSVTPDRWQDKFFAALGGRHLDKSAQPMLALKACKGPGKSFAIAIAAWWWMFTRWHCNGYAMSITEANLKDTLWAEIARIREGSPILQQFFDQRGERIEAKQYRKTWWISARSFPQNADKGQQANTIAGLHGRHPIILTDEVGDYPDGVIVAAEAIFSSLADPFDGRLVAAGNPTSTEGPLYRITTKDKKQWWVYEITGDPDSPERSPRINREWAQAQIDKWGRDNPYVLVNVFGKFPPEGSNKLMGPDAVSQAAMRMPESGYKEDPKIMGLDVARYGDNESVLLTRQGQMVWRPRIWRNIDLMTLADQVASEVVTQKPSALFIDASGIGGGVIDRLRQLHIECTPVDAGSPAIDDLRFANRKAEMWWKMADWLKKGGCIPEDVQLKSELVAPKFEYLTKGKSTKFWVESKADLIKRGLSSPDRADALALTFAVPVYSPVVPEYESAYRGLTQGNHIKIQGGTEDGWDPYAGD